MSDTVIKIENITKEYRLGAIGGGTLKGDLQSFFARIRGKEDPNSLIGSVQFEKGQKKRFNALTDVSFEVKKGDTLGLIGANGAGKSTLLKLLSRVTAPTSGSIYVKGRIASMLEVGTGFHPELTGRENVFLNGAILGMTKAEVSKKFDEIVAFAEMEQFIDTPVKRYSSGMYVKLAFAVAAHLDSEILIMDEVLAVGDAKFQQKCLGKMGDVAANDGRTVIYVSHNMNTVRALCNRCVVLQKGRKIFDGSVDEGIGLYMERKFSNQTFYDTSKTKREYFDYGKNLHITSLELLDKEEAAYYPSDKLKIKISFTSKYDIDSVRINLHFFYIDSTTVGVASSNVFSVKKSSTPVSKIIEMDISEFAAGKYCFAVITDNGNIVNPTVLDQPWTSFYFEMLNDPNDFSTWDHNFRGHIKFPQIEAK